MGRREENHIDAGIFHSLPRKTLQRKAAVPRQLGIDLALVAGGPVLAIAMKQEWLFARTMMREQPHQLKAGVPGGSENRGLYISVHLCFAITLF